MSVESTDSTNNPHNSTLIWEYQAAAVTFGWSPPTIKLIFPMHPLPKLSVKDALSCTFVLSYRILFSFHHLYSVSKKIPSLQKKSHNNVTPKILR